jgi:hypothetical protein
MRIETHQKNIINNIFCALPEAYISAEFYFEVIKINPFILITIPDNLRQYNICHYIAKNFFLYDNMSFYFNNMLTYCNKNNMEYPIKMPREIIYYFPKNIYDITICLLMVKINLKALEIINSKYYIREYYLKFINSSHSDLDIKKIANKFIKSGCVSEEDIIKIIGSDIILQSKL